MGGVCCNEDRVPQCKEEVVLEPRIYRSITFEEQLEEDADMKRIETIWKQYDVDKSGLLERDEAYLFLKEMMEEYTGEVPSQE